MIYKIGIRLNLKREGLLTSVFYSLNPISVSEIYSARWDVVANLIVFVTLYFLLQKKPYHVGLMISIGFFTKEFPLFFFAIVLIYWFEKSQWINIVKSIVAFIIPSIVILGLVLVPFGTSMEQIIQELLNHPIYEDSVPSCGDACHAPTIAPTQDIINIFLYFLDILELIYTSIWVIIFSMLFLSPMILYIKDPNEEKLMDWQYY